jgi:hypothetical protein
MDKKQIMKEPYMPAIESSSKFYVMDFSEFIYANGFIDTSIEPFLMNTFTYEPIEYLINAFINYDTLISCDNLVNYIQHDFFFDQNRCHDLNHNKETELDSITKLLLRDVFNFQIYNDVIYCDDKSEFYNDLFMDLWNIIDGCATSGQIAFANEADKDYLDMCLMRFISSCDYHLTMYIVNAVKKDFFNWIKHNASCILNNSILSNQVKEKNVHITLNSSNTPNTGKYINGYYSFEYMLEFNILLTDD